MAHQPAPRAPGAAPDRQARRFGFVQRGLQRAMHRAIAGAGQHHAVHAGPLQRAQLIRAGAGMKIKVPDDVSITSDVGIGPIPGGFGIQVAMSITLPGMTRDAAEALVAAAHKVCPYSNATRGNIDVTLTVV